MLIVPTSGKTRIVGKGELRAHDWLPDGRSMVCTDRSGNALAILPLEGDLTPRTLSHPPATKTQVRISPDGKFVAYTSWESERSQIFVASFPSFSERRQISVNGGLSPSWRKDGRELFFRTFDGTVMSAELPAGTKIESGIPRVLFRYTTDPYGVTYASTGDGSRFLTIEEGQKNEGAQLMVVINWMSPFKKQ
jgi:Tol biopolymer transport system component